MIRQQNNMVVNEHIKLQIKTLENAPRDAGKLEWLLKAKEKQREDAMHIEETERLVTKIQMLKVVLYLVNRNHRQQ
jgi:hypothetical protein